MIQLNLNARPKGALQILCLGCLSNDIEIGCGGAILRLGEQYPDCNFHWVVFSALGAREAEAKRAAELFVGASRLKDALLKSFPDGFMPFVGAEVKSVFEELKEKISPDIIFTHNRKDAHQNPRLVAELTWNTFRDHLILEYEIPKYDGDLGVPNFFVHLDHETCDRKTALLLEHFGSQRDHRWFTDDLFRSLLRLRGMEANSPSGKAEAFYTH